MKMRSQTLTPSGHWVAQRQRPFIIGCPSWNRKCTENWCDTTENRCTSTTWWYQLTRRWAAQWMSIFPQYLERMGTIRPMPRGGSWQRSAWRSCARILGTPCLRGWWPSSQLQRWPAQTDSVVWAGGPWRFGWGSTWRPDCAREPEFRGGHKRCHCQTGGRWRPETKASYIHSQCQVPQTDAGGNGWLHGN